MAQEPPRAVLITVLRLLGDVVLTMPLVDMVRAEHPDCAIDYLVPAGMGSLLRADPRIRHVIERRSGLPAYLPRILRKYDWAFSPNASDRSVIALGAAARRKRIAISEGNRSWSRAWRRAVLTSEIPIPRTRAVVKGTLLMARAAGLRPDACRVVLHDAPEDVEAVESFLQRHGLRTGQFAVVHGLSRQPFKTWDPARVAEVSDAIHERHGLRCVWTASPDAADRAALAAVAAAARRPGVQAAGALPLSAMHALMRRARIFVGVDTAITHIAAAAGTPMVALFGPTPTWFWAPWNNEQAPEYDFPTEPGSFRNGHISVLQDAETFRQEHRFGQMRMDLPSKGMAAITPSQVLHEVAHQLSLAPVHSRA